MTILTKWPWGPIIKTNKRIQINLDWWCFVGKMVDKETPSTELSQWGRHCRQQPREHCCSCGIWTSCHWTKMDRTLTILPILPKRQQLKKDNCESFNKLISFYPESCSLSGVLIKVSRLTWTSGVLARWLIRRLWARSCLSGVPIAGSSRESIVAVAESELLAIGPRWIALWPFPPFCPSASNWKR